MTPCINHLDREATFNSPEDYCDNCWATWWVEGLEPKNKAEEEILIRETLASINLRFLE